MKPTDHQLILLGICLFLTGCAATLHQMGAVFVGDGQTVITPVAASRGVNDCPHVYTWTLAQKKQLAAEDAKLSESSMVHRAILEDRDLRAQIAANKSCGGE